MRRRDVLALAGAAALAAPGIARAAGASVLRFIPQSDVTVIDPIWTTAYVTRNHGYLVFDTLFGTDASYKPSLQMLDSAATENDGKLWRLRLRPGLTFHDGEPVLARDCVASIRRWAARDAFGSALMAVTDELSAADDRTIVFRLKKPFPMLPVALGKPSTPMPAMMPERLAKTDPFKPVTELVGSGPYRFKADERVVGARVVYERFGAYKPREDSAPPDWTAGPKVAHFDRVEWIVIPDQATAAAAMQSGEADWWEDPGTDLLPLLRRAGNLVIEVTDPTGQIAFIRLNHLQPPFNNPAIRRALLGAVNQKDFVTAVAGTDPRMWRTGVGVFCPGTPMATDAGMEVLDGPRDLGLVKAEIAAAGYQGERTVVLDPADVAFRKALADICADTMRRAGLHVDEQAADWGTVVRRRENKGPVDQGGWSALVTNLTGLDLSNPVLHAFRANGEKAWFGWPTSPRLEELRQAWLDAADVAAQQHIARQIQLQFWIDVPHIPAGQYFLPTAYRNDLHGVLHGFPVFWNVRREA